MNIESSRVEDGMCSLESDTSLGVTADLSQEDWCSIDFDFAFFVDIKSGPEFLEIGFEV